jgi:hypothetical protein
MLKFIVWLFPKSVDAVLAEFHAVVAKLEKLEADLHSKADKAADKAKAISLAATLTRAEARKAGTVANNIKNLLK